MDSSSTLAETPKPSKRPVFQAETTGSYWGDIQEAAKRLSVQDVNRIGEIPCARNSLLSGIASGMGIGVIRGFSTSPLVASNWAVGTFLFVSFGMWQICQKNVAEERRRLQQVVETLPRRFAKKAEVEEPEDVPETVK